MFIVYSHRDEVIITTPENEPATVLVYFTEGGRDLEDYDREVNTENEVVIVSRLIAN